MPHIAESTGKTATPRSASVADERARLEKLQKKAAALETEARTLSRQRQQLALDVHNDDPAARQKLDKVRESSLRQQETRKG
jgi:hypothetical protein